MPSAKKRPVKNKKLTSAIIKIDWEGMLVDTEFMNIVALLGTLLTSKKRRPCVRQQVLNSMSAVATLLLAMDGKYTEALRLLDTDCLGASATGEIVKPVQRKKRISRR